MAGRLGYEYHYNFSIDDEILSLYEHNLFDGIKTFLFEFRTNFSIKRRPDETKSDTHLDFLARYRLNEYWMNTDEIDDLIRDAFNFAKQTATNTRHASLRVIPVVVGIEVRTVQQDDEPLKDTMARQIRAARLVPLYLWPFPTSAERKRISRLVICFLRSLSRIRVESVDKGMDVMRVCGICSQEPSVGGQISVLRCGHAFHSHCVVQWLESSVVCTSCDAKAHDHMLREPSRLERNA
ncbi:RING-H2 finger protein atl8 [Phtheirospermum japonicum]|uniref:RING-H2 finger protein atl8 n=1 Tax=Phtheirospermum japonicum TaxID=374723 RepID=A0A830CSV3_9LAMI|nr:RING-H2 finger protein atl8 [Phtheirospermum japonicum]